MCKAIENSTPEQKAKYLAGMAKTINHKAELILPWLHCGSAVDLGCSDGDFTIQLARKQVNFVTGIDMSAEIIKLARERGEEANLFGLSFKLATAENFSVVPVDNVVASSILHEVYSYGRGMESVKDALRNIHKNLKNGGRLIIRDFVKPENKTVDFMQDKNDIIQGHSFFDMFSWPEDEQSGSWASYKGVNLTEVYEYIFHKDYHTNWDTEIKETYGFWTMEQAKAILEDCGFKIIHSAELINDWILENRLRNKVMIDNPDGSPVPFPNYQMLLVVEKI